MSRIRFGLRGEASAAVAAAVAVISGWCLLQLVILPGLGCST